MRTATCVGLAFMVRVPFGRSVPEPVTPTSLHPMIECSSRQGEDKL